MKARVLIERERESFGVSGSGRACESAFRRKAEVARVAGVSHSLPDRPHSPSSPPTSPTTGNGTPLSPRPHPHTLGDASPAAARPPITFKHAARPVCSRPRARRSAGARRRGARAAPACSCAPDSAGERGELGGEEAVRRRRARAATAHRPRGRRAVAGGARLPAVPRPCAGAHESSARRLVAETQIRGARTGGCCAHPPFPIPRSRAAPCRALPSPPPAPSAWSRWPPTTPHLPPAASTTPPTTRMRAASASSLNWVAPRRVTLSRTRWKCWSGCLTVARAGVKRTRVSGWRERGWWRRARHVREGKNGMPWRSSANPFFFALAPKTP